MPGPAGPDRQTAWVCLITNLLVLPGLGSVLGGQRIGYAQIGLGLAGLASSLGFVAAFLQTWFRDADPWPGWPAVTAGLVGIALFALSWLWALWTSCRLLRQAKAPPVIARRPPPTPT